MRILGNERAAIHSVTFFPEDEEEGLIAKEIFILLRRLMCVRMVEVELTQRAEEEWPSVKVTEKTT